MYSQQPYVAAPMVDQRRPLPNAVTALFAIIQLILWIAVLALEGVSIYYDPGRGTIYAGFWCSGIFFITWIATFCFRKSTLEGNL